MIKRTKRSAVVIKQLDDNVVDLQPVIRKSFYQEVAMLWMLRDEPNFARIYGYAE